MVNLHEEKERSWCILTYNIAYINSELKQYYPFKATIANISTKNVKKSK
jgi:hypothetical protein